MTESQPEIIDVVPHTVHTFSVDGRQSSQDQSHTAYQQPVPPPATSWQRQYENDTGIYQPTTTPTADPQQHRRNTRQPEHGWQHHTGPVMFGTAVVALAIGGCLGYASKARQENTNVPPSLLPASTVTTTETATTTQYVEGPTVTNEVTATATSIQTVEVTTTAPAPDVPAPTVTVTETVTPSPTEGQGGGDGGGDNGNGNGGWPHQ